MHLTTWGGGPSSGQHQLKALEPSLVRAEDEKRFSVPSTKEGFHKPKKSFGDLSPQERVLELSRTGP